MSIMEEKRGEGLNPVEAAKIITDETSAKILAATYRKPMSAIELSQRYDIPIAACYRRIHLLEELGVLRAVKRVLTQKGKRITIYRSALKNAYIFFEDGQLKVRFQMANGITEDFGGPWNAEEVLQETE